MKPSVVAKHALHEGTSSQNPVLLHDLCRRVFEPQFHVWMEMQQFVALLSDEADIFLGCTSQANGFLKFLQSNTNLVQFFFFFFFLLGFVFYVFSYSLEYNLLYRPLPVSCKLFFLWNVQNENSAPLTTLLSVANVFSIRRHTKSV